MAQQTFQVPSCEHFLCLNIQDSVPTPVLFPWCSIRAIHAVSHSRGCSRSLKCFEAKTNPPNKLSVNRVALINNYGSTHLQMEMSYGQERTSACSLLQTSLDTWIWHANFRCSIKLVIKGLLYQRTGIKYL